VQTKYRTELRWGEKAANLGNVDSREGRRKGAGDLLGQKEGQKTLT